MLHFIDSRAGKPRFTVMAYDIGCPRRARRVRRVLDHVHHDKQYSVYEMVLGRGQCRGLLAELDALCDFDEDLLAVWWPHHGMRLSQHTESRIGVHCTVGTNPGNAEAAVRGVGNFVLCYDIADPRSLRKIAGIIAPETSMIQRSVYWFRAPAGRLLRLLTVCGRLLDTGDLLWAYPLRNAPDLWYIGEANQPIVPIADYRWEAP